MKEWTQSVQRNATGLLRKFDLKNISISPSMLLQLSTTCYLSVASNMLAILFISIKYIGNN